MKRVLIFLCCISLFSCGSKKHTVEEPIEFSKIVEVPLVFQNDTIAIPELQFSHVDSSTDAAVMMYQNYGDYSKTFLSKHDGDRDRFIWEDVQLFADSKETFIVIADGKHRRHPPFACLIVYDSNMQNCFEAEHPRKNDLIVLFTAKMKGDLRSKNRKQFEVKPLVNGSYSKSKERFEGTLTVPEYERTILNIEAALQTKIPQGKTLLINFNQSAPNCITRSFLERKNDIIVSNGIQISNRISAKYDILDFFVYTIDAPFNELYATDERFILDNGYFYNTMFDKHENCGAFFILKPDGSFMKYYGEDYFTLVIDFLKRK